MLPRIISISYGRKLFAHEDAERARLALCSRAVAEHHMIVFTLKRDGLSSERVHESFVLHPTNSLFRAAMLIDAAWIALRIMREARGETFVISAQDPLAAGLVGYIVRRITGARLLIQEHGDIFSLEYWRTESRSHRLWYLIARFLITRADRVRVVASRVGEHVHALGVPRARMVTLPVFVDAEDFIAAVPTTDLRALYPDASLIVLSVARFVPQKNLPMLVRAFAKLKDSEPGAHLVLVGKGNEEEKLRTLIAHHAIEDAVTIVPWTDDVASYMKTADIYALTSNYEGWGRVLLEAMACGLPVVTTDVGCVGDVFKDGVHGMVTPVGDEDAYAHALIALAQNDPLRAKAREAGPRDAQTFFDPIDEYAKKWASLHEF